MGKSDQRKVLVIEDNESFSLMLCSALRDAGYDVVPALNGSDGIKTALAWRPDLVLLDYNLGDMSGYDVALWLKCMHATTNVPFLILSSMGDDPFLVGTFRKLANCQAVFLKSRPLSEVLEAVSSILLPRGGA